MGRDQEVSEDDLNEQLGVRFYRLGDTHQDAEGWTVREVELVNDPDANCRITVRDGCA